MVIFFFKANSTTQCGAQTRDDPEIELHAALTEPARYPRKWSSWPQENTVLFSFYHILKEMEIIWKYISAMKQKNQYS